MSLIEDILDLSKMEAGTFKMNFTEFKLSELVTEVLEIFNFQYQQKRLFLNVVVADDLKSCIMYSDKCRLKQILINLLSNALKFTFKGGITITVNKLVTRVDKYLRFSIKDTGIGIKQEEQGSLFQLFGMLNDKKEINPNGSGIGLTVSKKYVEKLGGDICLESEFGIGTTITFTTPIQKQRR